MATEVLKAIRSDAAWAADQTAMEAIYGVGGYYTLLSAWESAQVDGADLVSLDECRTAVCYDDWPSGLDNQTTVAGATSSDSTRFFTVKAADGHGPFVGPNGGFHVSTNQNALIGSVDYTRFIGIRVTTTYATKSSTRRNIVAANYGLADSCISEANGVAAFQVSGTSCVITNCRGRSQKNHGYWVTGTAAEVYNSVAYDCSNVTTGSFGFSGSRADQIFKNNVAFGCDTDWSIDASATADSNASSDATAPGTNAVTSVVAGDFADTSTADYHLSGTGSALYQAGANLDSIFTNDIDGDTRPASPAAWDIGFDHYVSAGGGGHTLTVGSDTLSPEALAIAITQDHALAAAIATLTGEATAGALVQAHALGAAISALSPEALAAAITQTHGLVAGADTLTPESPSVTLPTAGLHTLISTADELSPEALAGVIVQHHQLAALTSDLTPEALAVAIAQTHQLEHTGPAHDTLSPEATAGAVVQVQSLGGAPDSSSPEATTGTVVQTHVLSESAAALLPEALAGAVVQAHALTSTGDTLTPESPSVLMGDVTGFRRAMYLVELVNGEYQLVTVTAPRHLIDLTDERLLTRILH